MVAGRLGARGTLACASPRGAARYCQRLIMVERVESGNGSGPGATLYVIPGSHACRTGMLLLAHKHVAHRIVRLPTGPHPLLVRLAGFPGSSSPIRNLDGATHPMLSTMDRLGTVPALRYGERRVQTNMAIARFLEQVRPEPPLFPESPERRGAVEEAERWGDEVLQGPRGGSCSRPPSGAWTNSTAAAAAAASGRCCPAARRSAGTPARSPDGSRSGRAPHTTPSCSRGCRRCSTGSTRGSRRTCSTARPSNAADLMIAPSLALIAYRCDLRPEIDARPAGSLLERVLPEPRMT